MAGINFAGEYNIQELKLFTSSGNVIDLSGSFVSMNIYEDIFSPCLTGDITVVDTNAIIMNAPVTGQDFLSFKITTPSLEKKGIESTVVPGVTSFLASAAALGTQLTLPGVTQTMIITRAEARTKVPKREQISELAKHQATLIFYLSVHLLNKISKEAIEGGYKKTTPVAVVYRASRKDQKIILGTLTDIAKKVRDEKIKMTAIVIIGDVIKPKSYEYSKLYDKTFSHGFRKAKKTKKKD